MVNRGPESEKVVDYVINNNFKSVFGNHDLHLMAILIGARKHNKKKDTMQKLITKNRAIDIIDYFKEGFGPNRDKINSINVLMGVKVNLID